MSCPHGEPSVDSCLDCLREADARREFLESTTPDFETGGHPPPSSKEMLGKPRWYERAAAPVVRLLTKLGFWG